MYEGNSKTMCYLFYIKFMYFLNRYYIHMVQNSKGKKKKKKFKRYKRAYKRLEIILNKYLKIK